MAWKPFSVWQILKVQIERQGAFSCCNPTFRSGESGQLKAICYAEYPGILYLVFKSSLPIFLIAKDR